ncbi:hypothetical protein C1645_831879 [Glomus cerebriforme]|uniref:Uncharacterized protein n=1 Tax=Glomus cerebriforme TaxID=658196 RepID=A0A397SIH5_9GLOM|nr:hypothetical protein C1645_831879 [Glomus cerebriforme]
MTNIIEALDAQINIEKEIQKHFSLWIIEELYNQIYESVLYQCKKISIKYTFEFNEDQLICNYCFLICNWTLKLSYLALGLGLKLGISIFRVFEIIKDCYDFWQTYLKALIASISNDLIKQITEYSKLIDKAVNDLLENNDQKNLNDIILSYIVKKEEKCETEAQLRDTESQNLSSIIRLEDSCHSSHGGGSRGKSDKHQPDTSWLQLTYVKVAFLPPTTSHLQPLNRKTRILSSLSDKEKENASETQQEVRNNEITDIDRIIREFDIDDLPAISLTDALNSFFQDQEEILTENILNKNNIIKLIQEEMRNDDDNNDSEEEEILVSPGDALKFLQT